MKIIKSVKVQAFIYPDNPHEFEETTIELFADGDVRLTGEEADIIITLDDMFDTVKDFVDALLAHKIEEQAAIIKQLEVLNEQA
tara:strand:- start:473 stop:724 length:252 start_codon:yes stop_codon:yes gene_type:complete